MIETTAKNIKTLAKEYSKGDLQHIEAFFYNQKN